MRKARILFLDDEPKMNRRFKDILEHHGYHVSEPKNLEEALHEIEKNQAELMIHSLNTRTQTYGKICKQIIEVHPRFPSIHLAAEVSSHGFSVQEWSVLKGAFHYKMRLLTPERQFLKRVRKMIFLGRMHRENTTLRKAEHYRAEMDLLLQIQDGNAFKEKITQVYAREMKAEQAYFLNYGAFQYFVHDHWKVHRLTNHEDMVKSRQHAVISLNPITIEEMSREMQAIEKQGHEVYNNDWQPDDTITFINGTNGRKNIAIIPFIGFDDHPVAGHVILVDPKAWPKYDEYDLSLLRETHLRLVGRHVLHLESLEMARGLSYVDDVTALHNQRYLKLILDQEIARSQRTGATFSVLFMDIDHFKKVNDTRGHVVGSKILAEVAQILKRSIRSVDHGFRYGGDEFMVVLTDTDSAKARVVAERIRARVEQNDFVSEGQKLKVTMSIGIATFPDHASTREEIIEMADRAMYCGKNQSRNVVYVAS